MKVAEKFLSLYKEYESLMRDKGIDCKEYEDSTDEFTGNRLRMCRLFRNYLSHQNDSGFLDISAEQIKFLEQIIFSLKMENDVLKKHIKSVKSAVFSYNEKCYESMEKVLKLKSERILVSYDGLPAPKTLYGVLSVYDVLTNTHGQARGVV